MDSETLITTLPAISTLIDDDQQAIPAHVESARKQEEISQPEHAAETELPSMLEWMLQMEQGRAA
jgi:hypothetical protein